MFWPQTAYHPYAFLRLTPAAIPIAVEPVRVRWRWCDTEVRIRRVTVSRLVADCWQRCVSPHMPSL